MVFIAVSLVKRDGHSFDTPLRKTLLFSMLGRAHLISGQTSYPFFCARIVSVLVHTGAQARPASRASVLEIIGVFRDV